MAKQSLLSKVRKGKIRRPPRILIYGTEGIGKSTFAACAPDPIFIQAEDGLDEIDTSAFPLCESYEDALGYLDAVVNDEHEFATVAIDSLDWLERLVWDRVCRDHNCTSIEKADGGYAKGYTHALTYWREILDRLDRCRNHRGMAVVLVAHAKVEKFEDPEATSYDRYAPRLHKHAVAMVSEWVDATLFATRKIRTTTEDAGFNRKRSIAKALGKDGAERVLRCVGSPSCVAKNRYGITEEIPLSWDAFASAMAEGQESGTGAEE